MSATNPIPLPILAISAKDCQEFGCPYCGEHPSIMTTLHTGLIAIMEDGAAKQVCARRSCARTYIILRDGVELSPIATGACSSGPLYAQLSPHPLKPDPNRQRPTPAWFHADGAAMHVGSTDPFETRLVIRNASNSATLAIAGKDHAFQITWHLEGPGEGDESHGTRRFFVQDLLSAFGVVGDPGEREFVDRHRADSGRPGLWLRQGNFLNIPGPGTGVPGDANISIELTDVMRAAIRELVD